MEKKLVGRPGKRKDARSEPPVTNWKTDVIESKEDGYFYQFFREDEVRSKLVPSRVRLTNYETGETEVYDVPAWELVLRDTGPETAAGFRPDESKTGNAAALTHGGGGTTHWCMKIPMGAYEILSAAQEQRADAYDSKLDVKRHYSEAWGPDQGSTNPYSDEHVRPGEIRRFEQFNKA